MGNAKELMKDIVKVILFFILFASIPITLGIIGGIIEVNQSEKNIITAFVLNVAVIINL